MYSLSMYWHMDSHEIIHSLTHHLFIALPFRLRQFDIIWEGDK